MIETRALPATIDLLALHRLDPQRYPVAGKVAWVTPARAAAGPAAWPIERWSGDAKAALTADTAPAELPALAASRPWRLCAVYPHLKDSYWLAVNYGMVEEARALDRLIRDRFET